jgi:hypothetical protein
VVKSFIIAADEATTQWYSLLSPEIIFCREDLKQRIISNFQGFQRPQLIERNLFSCKQKEKRAAPKLFQEIFPPQSSST